MASPPLAQAASFSLAQHGEYLLAQMLHLQAHLLAQAHLHTLQARLLVQAHMLAQVLSQAHLLAQCAECVHLQLAQAHLLAQVLSQALARCAECVHLQLAEAHLLAQALQGEARLLAQAHLRALQGAPSCGLHSLAQSKAQHWQSKAQQCAQPYSDAMVRR